MNNSIVTDLVDGSVRAILTDDSEAPCEKAITNHPKVTSQILNVGHHGSKAASNKLVLDQVGADVALIRAGKGTQFGHPTREVLKRSNPAGAAVRRAEDKGTMVVTSNGSNYSIIIVEKRPK